MAEDQAKVKQELFDNENFDLNETIKNELAEVLPQIKFGRMNFQFVSNFVGMFYDKILYFNKKILFCSRKKFSFSSF